MHDTRSLILEFGLRNARGLRPGLEQGEDWGIACIEKGFQLMIGGCRFRRDRRVGLSRWITMNCLTGLSNNQGLGLVEILVALLLVGLGIMGFGMAIPLGKDSIDEMREERVALFLAKQMMEEIQSKEFEDPGAMPLFGLEGGEFAPRDNFDDVDDYDNWDQSPPQYPNGDPLDGQGGRPDYRDFRRKVVVGNVDDVDFSFVRGDSTTDSKKITVTVSSVRTPVPFPDVVLKWVANRDGMDLLY